MAFIAEVPPVLEPPVAEFPTVEVLAAAVPEFRFPRPDFGWAKSFDDPDAPAAFSVDCTGLPEPPVDDVGPFAVAEFVASAGIVTLDGSLTLFFAIFLLVLFFSGVAFFADFFRRGAFFGALFFIEAAFVADFFSAAALLVATFFTGDALVATFFNPTFLVATDFFLGADFLREFAFLAATFFAVATFFAATFFAGVVELEADWLRTSIFLIKRW